MNCFASMKGKGRNKLGTYNSFKSEYGVFVKVLVPFKDRSVFAKFRCEVAPITFETGRYENINHEKKIQI